MNKEIPNNLFEGNQWELPTDINIITKTMEAFQAKLIEQGWPEDDANWLGATFEEMLINSIVHGNLGIKEKSSEESWREAGLREQVKANVGKMVHVKLDVTPDEITVQLRDEGEGFDWRKMLKEDEALLKSSGKGHAFLKMNLFDSFEYNEAGNEVTLKKKK